MAFRFLGIDVTIGTGFLLLVAFLVVQASDSEQPLLFGLTTAAIALVSILVHEFGHAWLARLWGLRVYGIQVGFLGGVTRHDMTTPRRQLGISLAGPAAGLMLSLAFLVLAVVAPDGWLQWASALGWQLNLFWSLFNLLPIQPMDGGRALAAALQLTVGPVVAIAVAGAVGALLGALGAVGMYLIGAYIGAVFLAIVAIQNALTFSSVWNGSKT